MITVRKQNIELNVDNEQKDRYLKLGYSVIDETTGDVIEEAPIQDVGALQVKVSTLTEENQELQTKVAELEAEIKKLKSRKTKATE